MSLLEKINKDIITAMKEKSELKLSTLRSVKTALDRYRVDQKKPLDEKAEQSILNTLGKQRKESATAFRLGNREALAEKEESEYLILETYMLQEATELEISDTVNSIISEFISSGKILTSKDMGLIMKVIPEKLKGKRYNGSVVSSLVKQKLENI